MVVAVVVREQQQQQQMVLAMPAEAPVAASCAAAAVAAAAAVVQKAQRGTSRRLGGAWAVLEAAMLSHRVRTKEGCAATFQSGRAAMRLSHQRKPHPSAPTAVSVVSVAASVVVVVCRRRLLPHLLLGVAVLLVGAVVLAVEVEMEVEVEVEVAAAAAWHCSLLGAAPASLQLQAVVRVPHQQTHGLPSHSRPSHVKPTHGLEKGTRAPRDWCHIFK